MSKRRKSKRPSDAQLDEVAELRVAVRRFQAASDRVTRLHGLTSRQYDLLALLHASSGEDAAGELADKLAITRNSMTELVTRAADAGLVTRLGDDHDGRRKPIVPTREGTARFYAAVADLAPERDLLLGLLRHAARQVSSASS